MGLETFNFIDSLNASNPVHATDDVSQGDDHLRGIKTTLLNTFPNLDAAVNFTPTEANRLVGLTGLTGTGNLVASDNPTFTNLALSATVLTSGQLVDARVQESNVTQHEAALSILEAQISDFGSYYEAGDSPSFANLTLTGSLADFGSASLSTDNDSADEVGFKGTPQSIEDGDYTLVLADAGTQIYKSAGGAGETITIPANASVAFPIGTIIVVINDGGGDLTIAITTDTLEKYGSSTGSQTLGDNNKAVLEKVTATLWKYSSSD